MGAGNPLLQRRRPVAEWALGDEIDIAARAAEPTLTSSHSARDADVLIWPLPEHYRIRGGASDSGLRVSAMAVSDQELCPAAVNLWPMGEVRRATAADAAELVQLRGVPLAGMAGHEAAGDGWRRAASEILRTRLAEPDPTLVTFVVERSDRQGAPAACAVGAVEYRLGGTGNPTGETGYVFNVATDPDHRRRGPLPALHDGIARLVPRPLVKLRTLDLRTSPEGEPRCRVLGFVRTPDPAMGHRLPAADA